MLIVAPDRAALTCVCLRAQIAKIAHPVSGASAPRRIAAIHGDAQRSQLEASGKVREAEQASLEQQKEGELAEAKHRRDESLNTQSSLKDQIAARVRYFEEVSAIDGKYGAAQSELAKKQRNDQIEHDNEVGNKIVSGRLEHLKSLASIGDIHAGVEARRLETQQKYNEKRQEYNRILRDDKATAEEKAQAKQALAGLSGDERIAQLFKFNAGSGNPVGEFKDAGRSTGIAERYRQNFDPMKPVIEILQKQLKVAEDTHEAITKGNGPDNGSGDKPIFPPYRVP